MQSCTRRRWIARAIPIALSLGLGAELAPLSAQGGTTTAFPLRQRDLVTTPNGLFSAATSGFNDVGGGRLAILDNLTGASVGGPYQVEGFNMAYAPFPPADNLVATNDWIVVVGKEWIPSRVSFIELTPNGPTQYQTLDINTGINEFPLDVEATPDSTKVVVHTSSSACVYDISQAGMQPVQLFQSASPFTTQIPVNMSDWIAVGNGTFTTVRNDGNGCKIQTVNYSGVDILNLPPIGNEWAVDVDISPDGRWVAVRTVEAFSAANGVTAASTFGSVVLIRTDTFNTSAIYSLPAIEGVAEYPTTDYIEVSNDQVIAIGTTATNAAGAGGPANRNNGRHRIDAFNLPASGMLPTAASLSQTGLVGYGLDLAISPSGGRAAVRSTHFLRGFSLAPGAVTPYGADIASDPAAGPLQVDFASAPCPPRVSDWVDLSDTRIAFYSAYRSGLGTGSHALLLDSTGLFNGSMRLVYAPPGAGGVPAWNVTTSTYYDVDVAADDWGSGWNSPDSITTARNLPMPGFTAPVTVSDATTVTDTTACSQVGVDFLEMVGQRVVTARELASGSSEISVRDLAPPVPPPFTAYCFGDGSGHACPCGNWGGTGEGCANSTGLGGVLSATGTPSVMNDSLVLQATQLPPNQFAVFFQGDAALNGGLGTTIDAGDGLRCAGGNTVRLQIVLTDGTGSGMTTVGIAALAGVTTGVTRYYQVNHREMSTHCGLEAINWTNGLSVVWAP